MEIKVANSLSQELISAQPFDFSGCLRNMALTESGFKPPEFAKTGTTIVGAVYKDGVVMGGDSRATCGHIVANKQSLKVVKLTDRIYACGAGGAADLYQMSSMLSANLRLHELNTGSKARVAMALRRMKQHLFQHMGHIAAYLVIGGVDLDGAHLFSLSANGTSQRRQFVSDGSGSYIANSVLERDFKVDMTEKECSDLVSNALSHGMKGDNMSGNSFNLVIINDKGATLNGPIVPDFCKRPCPIDLDYRFKKGISIVVKEKTINYDVVEELEEKRMEVD